MCDYPLIPLNESTVECALSSDVHGDYYIQVRGFAVVIALLSLLISVCTLAKTKMGRMDGQIASMLMVAGLFQCIRAVDPSGMGGYLDYKVSLALLVITTTLVANAQVGSLSGYLVILDRLTPQKIPQHKFVFTLSKFTFGLKICGDFIVVILLFVLEDKLFIAILFAFTMSSGVYIVHPVACFFFSKKLASASKNVFVGSGNLNDKKIKQKGAANARLRNFSSHIRILAIFNFLAYMTLVTYCVLERIQFTNVEDPFTQWRLFYFLVDVVIPFIQLSMMFCCLKVFASAAEVMEDHKIRSVAFGIFALIALVTACSHQEALTPDD